MNSLQAEAILDRLYVAQECVDYWGVNGDWDQHEIAVADLQKAHEAVINAMTGAKK